MTFHFPLERDGEEVNAEVECEWHKPHRGARDSCCGVRNAGPPLEPDEDGYWEITSIIGPGEYEMHVTEDELERIQDKADTYGNDF